MTAAASLPPASTAPTLLDRRVDWFELRARVKLTRATIGKWDTVATLRRAAKKALDHGVAPVVLGRLAFGELRAPTRPGCYRIVNADYALEIDTALRELGPDAHGDEVAREGLNVHLTWRAAALAERGFDPLLSVDLLRELGQVHAVRLARVDVAATFAGWAIHESDRTGLVVRSRAKIERYFTAEKVGLVLESARARSQSRRVARADVAMHGGATPTGYSVGAGGDVMARVYDKVAELVAKGDLRRHPETGALAAKTAKGEIELALWGQGGVDARLAAPPPITRVEFQLRGAALDEFGIRDPKKVRDALGPIWRYLTGVSERPADAPPPSDIPPGGASSDAGSGDRPKGFGGWMRLTIPTSATRRKRAAIDPRWEAVRAVGWAGAGSIAQRVRRLSRGAHWKQAIGASLGAIAEARLLREPRVNQGRHAFDARVYTLRKGFEAEGADPFAAYARAVEIANEERVRAMPEDVALRYVHEEMVQACLSTALLARDALVTERGARGALAWILTKWEATRLRFARLRADEWRAAERERKERLASGPHPFQLYAHKMTG